MDEVDRITKLSLIQAYKANNADVKSQNKNGRFKHHFTVNAARDFNPVLDSSSSYGNIAAAPGKGAGSRPPWQQPSTALDIIGGNRNMNK